MIREEKYLLLELIMTDIRMWWGREGWWIFKRDCVKKRRARAMEIAADLIETAILGRLLMLEPGDDGRWLRAPYERGGYEDIELMHGYQYDLQNRYSIKGHSDEFLEELKILKCPLSQYFRDYE